MPHGSAAAAAPILNWIHCRHAGMPVASQNRIVLPMHVYAYALIFYITVFSIVFIVLKYNSVSYLLSPLQDGKVEFKSPYTNKISCP